MTEGDVSEKFNADMHTVARFLSAWQVQIATFRCAGTDEDSIVIFRKYFLKTGNVMIKVRMNPQRQDVVYFFIEDTFGKPESRYLCAHHSTALVPFVVEMDFITKWRKVARNC